jgi:NAD+ kinase
MKEIAFVINGHKEGAPELAEALMKAAQKEGWNVRYTDAYPLKADFLAGVDLCCVLGGDGTLLSSVPEALRNEVPVFGVNQGNLGFLAGYSVFDATKTLLNVLRGNSITESRPVLEAHLSSGEIGFALNDVVIKHNLSNRMIRLSVSFQNEWVTDYAGDGLIFCAPTGSTAYNLSAGGPILHPHLRVMAMTPICPHTLSNRSVIFPGEGVAEVVAPELILHPDSHALLSLDGRLHASDDCRTIFPLNIKLSKKNLQLIFPQDYSYFKVLRSKLKWGPGEVY